MELSSALQDTGMYRSSNSTHKTKGEFLEHINSTVRSNKNKTFVTWYDDNGKATNKYTFEELWKESGIVAYHLRIKWGLEKGDKVVLCYHFGIQFIASLLGCLRAGIIAVLVYPPSRPLTKSLPKMSNVVNDCKAKLILTDFSISLLRQSDQANPISNSRHLWPRGIIFKVHMATNKTEPCFDDETLTLSDIAFLQYTSGSTGNPKGVIVTHGALQANVSAIKLSIEKAHDDCGLCKSGIIGFSWLPQYHDMGLITAIIAPLVAGWRCHMISPISFIKNPLLWINLMSKLKTTWSVAPDFGYRLAARKMRESKHSNFDLSSIAFLLSAAEPIRPSTVTVFQDIFRKYGLRDNWFVSGYGLAENVVYVAHIHTFKLSEPRPENGATFVAVGHESNFPASQIAKIVSPTLNKELRDGTVGELWLSSPSTAHGYFGKPDLTNETFRAKLTGSDDTFLRTGDLAFFEEGYLYICGRLKDLVIVNGVNYYPQDIEFVVQGTSSAVRPGCVAAFSSDDAGGDGDLEIIFEIRSTQMNEAENIVNAVYMGVMDKIGLIPSRIVAIKERTILKTTSGKIQRRANRDTLHDNKHKIIYEYNSSRFQKKRNDGVDASSSYDGKDEKKLKDDDAVFNDIMQSFFRYDFDPNLHWDELGLSSILSVQLRDSINESFAISLSPDCFDKFTCPAQLKQFVTRNQGKRFSIELKDLEKATSFSTGSWIRMGIVQGICSVFVLCIFVFSIVPAWYVETLVYENSKVPLQDFGTNRNIHWSWYPFAVPVWMLSYSCIVVALKWVLIGRYTEGIVQVFSMVYLRWWVVDRAVHLWEFWVGRFILNTPLMNLFYTAMGARIGKYVEFGAFIREFDLFQIHKESSIQSSLNCRKFGLWDNTSMSPSLRFRKIRIGYHCTVKGIVQLGSSIGNETFICKSSVTPEGAQVPNRTLVRGNPAFLAKKNYKKGWSPSQYKKVLLNFLKIFWLGFELYMFFAIMLLAQFLWVIHLPTTWRYTHVLKWSLLLLWFSFVSTLISVALKWIMIGKRKPGNYSDSTFRKFCDWAADWHFQTSTCFLLSFSSHSRMWNIILKLHGMNIDFKSRLASVGTFLPSKIDLIEVKESFVSAATFESKRDSQYFNTKIERSSVGLLAHIGPAPNLVVSNSVISPLSVVTESITQTISDSRMIESSMLDILLHELKLLIGYVMCFVLFFCTLLPSFELWMIVFNNSQSIWKALYTLACALTLQTLVWTAMLALFQFIALALSKDGSPWSKTIFQLYGTIAFCHQQYSMIKICLGSPLHNFLLKFLGVKIDGHALVMPQRMYEYSLLSFGDKTIIDSAQICGHYAVYNEITVGPCRITGTMHPGCCAANAEISFSEVGPLRAFVGNKQSCSKAGFDSKIVIASDNGNGDPLEKV